MTIEAVSALMMRSVSHGTRLGASLEEAPERVFPRSSNKTLEYKDSTIHWLALPMRHSPYILPLNIDFFDAPT